jgi:hypothetical protein
MYIYKSKGVGWIPARGPVVAFFTTALGQGMYKIYTQNIYLHNLSTVSSIE